MAVIADAVIDMAHTAGRGVIRIVDSNGHIPEVILEVRPTNGRLLISGYVERTAADIGAVWLPVPKG
jgi:hypothetical protein